MWNKKTNPYMLVYGQCTGFDVRVCTGFIDGLRYSGCRRGSEWTDSREAPLGRICGMFRSCFEGERTRRTKKKTDFMDFLW